jgi:hypothetical protein
METSIQCSKGVEGPFGKDPRILENLRAKFNL